MINHCSKRAISDVLPLYIRRKGAGGPSNVDANGFQSILNSKSFKKSASNLYDALATLAGHKSGSEAAVHAMNSLFQHEDNDAVLLVDASNAFNLLNRAVALHNIRIICPALATFAINIYRASARLFLTGGGGGVKSLCLRRVLRKAIP